jgi:hypothetical protein
MMTPAVGDNHDIYNETLAAELSVSAEKGYRGLRDLAWACIGRVAFGVGMPNSAAAALLEGQDQDNSCVLPCVRPEESVVASVEGQSSSKSNSSGSNVPSLSGSNFTGINYGVNDGCLTQSAHCPFHTDKCLVTVIPLARTDAARTTNEQKDEKPDNAMQAGLRVFDWHAQCWVDVETNAPQPQSGLKCTGGRQFALVFGGESLARATNGFIEPAVHEVLQPKPFASGTAASEKFPSFRRCSTPFQAFAPPDAVFDCSILDPNAVGDIPPHRASPVSAQVFLSQLSQGMLSCY